MKIKLQVGIFSAFLLFSLNYYKAFSQTCTGSIASDANFGSISWTGSGGISDATCTDVAQGNNTTAVANFNLTVSNSSGVIITISNNVTIHGNFDVPNNAAGANSTIKVDGAGVVVPATLNVSGNIGDATNNNITYDVVSVNDHIVVGGTLFGKNGNDFIGNGSIGGYGLNVNNNAACGSPCPVSGNFQACTSDGGANTFCTTYGVPILLSSFSAFADDQIVKLKWSTDSEINFDHFVLERSGNGKTFSELAKIKGSGFSNTRKEYSYLDQNPLIGNSYYRLTSVDFDNYTEVFNNNVVRVTVNAGKNFYIAPNPIEGLSLKAGINFDASNTHVVIYDRMGSAIGHYNASGSEFELQLPNLPNGVYFAQIQSDGFTKSVRFAVNQ